MLIGLSLFSSCFLLKRRIPRISYCDKKYQQFGSEESVASRTVKYNALRYVVNIEYLVNCTAIVLLLLTENSKNSFLLYKMANSKSKLILFCCADQQA